MRKTLIIFLIIFSTLTLTIPIAHFAPKYTAQAQTQPSVTFDSTSINGTSLGQTFTLNIQISNVQTSHPLWGWAVNVTWDSRFVTFQKAQEGSFLSDQIDDTYFVPTQPYNFTDPYHNSLTYEGIKLTCSGGSGGTGMEQSASGNGVLATLTFQMIKQTQSTPIALTVEYLMEPIEIVPNPGSHPQITPVSNTFTTLVSLILPGPPTANGGRDQTVVTGTKVIFNASQTVSTGTNTNYTWTFMDGVQQNLTGMIANYTFNNPGNYTVTLTVTDSLGTDSCNVIIHVLGDAQATAAPTETPDATSTPTSAATATSTTESVTATPTESQTFNLSPTIVGIILVFTIFIFGGSIFWLRQRT